ncbi:hypothetical protein MMC31_000990 [Peltigera leucophlebia]|nr:hypothetical protein [Peltigera leucophlebia]
MAEMFGEGATNHSIKGQFAKLKKMIPALSNSSEGAITAPSTPNQKKRAERKPKKNDEPGLDCGKVLKGRVQKTPTKSKKGGNKDENTGSEDGNDF